MQGAIKHGSAARHVPVERIRGGPQLRERRSKQQARDRMLALHDHRTTDSDQAGCRVLGECVLGKWDSGKSVLGEWVVGKWVSREWVSGEWVQGEWVQGKWVLGEWATAINQAGSRV